MKKIIAFIVLCIFLQTSVYAQESVLSEQNYYGYDSAQNIKINQNGNQVKVKVSKENNVNRDIYDDSIVNQNNSGREDVVTVKTFRTNAANSSFSKANVIGGVAGALLGASAIACVLIFDPYAIKINGQKYYMVRDKEDNQYSVKDILGYDDTKTELFDDMKCLNSDDDNTKITQEELKKAGIRFVALKNNKLQLYDKSQDYNIDNIQYIDLTTLRGTINNGKIGSFGYFDMYINDSKKAKKIIGFVTFDSDSTLNEMIKQ